MKKYVQLFEEFVMGGVYPEWAKPNAVPGNIGKTAVANSFSEHQDPSQSMVNFTVGDTVRCINPEAAGFGRIGQIVAFEDATIRWRQLMTETTVGTDALEFRCHPQDLEKFVAEEVVVIPNSKQQHTVIHQDSGTNQTDVATQ